MTVGKTCTREVDLASPSDTVSDAARRMAASNVGTLVVVDCDRRPKGIVTDRDLTVRVLAEGVDPDGVRVDQVMSTGVESVSETGSLEDALEVMRRGRVRRVPVVDSRGGIVGILSIDDLLRVLMEEFRSMETILERAGPGAAAE